MQAQKKAGIIGTSTYIVTSQNANDFAVAVQLAEYPLLHVLIERNRECQRFKLCTRSREHIPSSILAGLEAS